MLADIYANRAMCYQQQWNPKQVVADCTESLKLVSNNPKALVRRAQAYEGLEKYEDALADFNQAALLEVRFE